MLFCFKSVLLYIVFILLFIDEDVVGREVFRFTGLIVRVFVWGSWGVLEMEFVFIFIVIFGFKIGWLDLEFIFVEDVDLIVGGIFIVCVFSIGIDAVILILVVFVLFIVLSEVDRIGDGEGFCCLVFVFWGLIFFFWIGVFDFVGGICVIVCIWLFIVEVGVGTK